MKYTFRGGIHVPEHKHTENSEITKLAAPSLVSIPMSQHIGAPCEPAVKVGDSVLVGQLIGEVKGGLGAPIHSGVSGKVKAIVDRLTPMGNKVKFIEIENDGLNTYDPNLEPCTTPIGEMTAEEIIDRIRAGGIVGLGGATFPTHAKINSCLGKVDKLIINCAECEPYLTANHRLMLEHPDYIIGGIKILLKAVGVTTCYIAIEDNKPDAIDIMKYVIAEDGCDMISVKVMKTKYPQGDERQLIYALTGYELPQGKLPSDAGCIIFNGETTAAIYNLFLTGMPLVKRVVTVDGDCVNNPSNFYVPIGTPYSYLIEACGGLKRTPKRIISGGPMMGFAQWDSDAPVTKGTSGLLVMSKQIVRDEALPSACIRCGRCIRNCPMHLMPSYFAMFSRAGDYDRAEKMGVMSCVECGSCSYNCPGQVNIVQLIRVAKNAIRTEQAKAKAAAENKK